MKKYDILIIGAGPCGLACAIEAKENNLEYIILEKGSIAESIRKYPIHMKFFSTADNISIANIPFAVSEAKATRSEALQYYRKVTEYFALNIRLFTEVINIEKSEDFFQITTQKQETYFAKNVVLATGYFDCPRNLNIAGERLPHVKKYYDEPFEYVHSKVIIVGGGNSAVETALDLYRHGVEVTMLVREDSFKPTAKYWLIPDLRNRINEGAITAHFGTEVTRIEKNRVWTKMKNRPAETMIPADFVFLLIGYTSDVEFMQKAGIKVNQEDLTPTYNKENFETNIEGIYLAGTSICGIHTEKVFIENGRWHGKAIVKNILAKI